MDKRNFTKFKSFRRMLCAITPWIVASAMAATRHALLYFKVFSLAGDPCASSPCRNGGSCHEATGSYNTFYCSCAPGWMGESCQEGKIWASYQIPKIAGCACTGNSGNVFPTTAGRRSRPASRHVRHARAVMHAGIANPRFPLKSVAGKTFPAFLAHAQPKILSGKRSIPQQTHNIINT